MGGGGGGGFWRGVNRPKGKGGAAQGQYGGLGELGWTLFNVERWWRYTGGQVEKWREQYSDQQRDAQYGLFQAGGALQPRGAAGESANFRARTAAGQWYMGKAGEQLLGPRTAQVGDWAASLTDQQRRNITGAMTVGGGLGMWQAGLSGLGGLVGGETGEFLKFMTPIGLGRGIGGGSLFQGIAGSATAQNAKALGQLLPGAVRSGGLGTWAGSGRTRGWQRGPGGAIGAMAMPLGVATAVALGAATGGWQRRHAGSRVSGSACVRCVVRYRWIAWGARRSPVRWLRRPTPNRSGGCPGNAGAPTSARR